MTGSEIAQLAKQELSELTGHKPDSVSAMRHDDEGWHVTVDMLDLERVPDSTDVLGTYDVLMDDEGDLIHYRRVRRYLRSDAMEEAPVETQAG